MSTSEEIQAVFEHDIYQKTLSVMGRRGVAPFLEGAQNMHLDSATTPLGGDGTLVRDFRTKSENE